MNFNHGPTVIISVRVALQCLIKSYHSMASCFERILVGIIASRYDLDVPLCIVDNSAVYTIDGIHSFVCVFFVSK
jgi:hypothetical protein